MPASRYFRSNNFVSRFFGCTDDINAIVPGHVETVCQVLHEDGKAAESNSYMWIYLTGNDGLPQIILYEYQLGRKGEYAKNFLEKGSRGFWNVTDTRVITVWRM